jgi:hypothetical protein
MDEGALEKINSQIDAEEKVSQALNAEVHND